MGFVEGCACQGAGDICECKLLETCFKLMEFEPLQPCCEIFCVWFIVLTNAKPNINRKGCEIPQYNRYRQIGSVSAMRTLQCSRGCER